ncbi:hypothetical protein [Oceanirhabdus sp. W0125-5]|uniref:hypothetical protein n=1 Tax=Oceanirhabdus sp. W0125-5 TaxID=2999116 RepID=UPI0022F2D9AB|nr:hypothetical protein [Oceanirhabdus sp. W0125-5]WBW99612.1 hypothetical protein OW730_12945 [Oceanirhabdus sp. W0125-5]
MKKKIIIITSLLALMMSINIFSRVHISYEEFAYNTVYGLIKDQLNDRTFEEVIKFIDKDDIDEFLESSKQFNYPELELPNKFRTPLLNEDNNINLVNTKYYLDSGKWINSPINNSRNVLEYNLHLSKVYHRASLNEVQFNFRFTEKIGENHKITLGRISILLDKNGFNKYEIENISIRKLHSF